MYTKFRVRATSKTDERKRTHFNSTVCMETEFAAPATTVHCSLCNTVCIVHRTVNSHLLRSVRCLLQHCRTTNDCNIHTIKMGKSWACAPTMWCTNFEFNQNLTSAYNETEQHSWLFDSNHHINGGNCNPKRK